MPTARFICEASLKRLFGFRVKKGFLPFAMMGYQKSIGIQ